MNWGLDIGEFLDAKKSAGPVLSAGFAILAISYGLIADWSVNGFVVAFAVLTALAGSILIFTRPLKTVASRRTMFRFAYGFILLVFVGSFYLLIVLNEPLLVGQGPPAEKQDCGLAEKACPERYPVPLAIVPGCVYTPQAYTDGHAIAMADTNAGQRIEHAGMPVGAYCDQVPPQWVVSIGGYILKCHIDGTCGPRPRQTELTPAPSPAELQRLQQAEQEAVASIRDIQAQLSAAQAERSALEGAANTPFGQANQGIQDSLRAAISTVTALREQLRQARELSVSSRDALAAAQARLAPVDTGVNVLQSANARLITGGIVVPLYFVVLALLGALVSMMRKTPEFQRRSSNTYREQFDASPPHLRDDANPPMDAHEARELIVFQILQVVAAPVIGIVAFSFIKPEQTAETAVLAFAAGFSSEVILIVIRKIAETAMARGIPKYAPRTLLAGSRPTNGDPASAASAAGPRPRGPVRPHNPGAAAMNTGDRIELTQPLGPFRPGTKGVVVAIDSAGFITMMTTENEAGVAVQFTLPPQSADFFRLAGDDTGQATEGGGPVG